MRKRLERIVAPYEGDEPYVHLCFSAADAAAVEPLACRLQARGVRLWYALGSAKDPDDLARRNRRADGAALTVLYLTEAARHDTAVKNTVLYRQEREAPLLCLDADEGDHGLSVGLTRAVPHVAAWQLSSADELEDALIHAPGFVQELVGPRPVSRVDPLRRLTLLLAALAVAACAAGAGLAWQRGLLLPASHHPGDIPELASPQLVAAARQAQGGGALTHESLARITALRLDALPDDLSELGLFPALERLELPQAEAAHAAPLLDAPYDIVLVGG